ncbi:hypothetical protein AbraIFM66951_011751 [Aspergillus brasiliensis]|nr:hypothetical protein AbraIFM66951_011751 [Aspergillus brasiliensis]
MPSRRATVVPSAFAGGYSQAVRNRLDKVVFPDRIKCGTCKKFRYIGAFSNRQLDILRNAVVVEGAAPATSGHARCRQCTGPGNTELKCAQCDRVKSIDEFAKNQRQERDAASQAGGSSLTESLRRIQISGAHNEGSICSDDQDDDEDLSTGGGVFLEPRHTDENSSTNRGKEKVFTGYDPQGNPHIITHRAEATQSCHSGWSVWGVKNKALGSEAGPAKAPPKRESKFAKIPGGRFEKHEMPSMSIPESSGATIPSDDEEESEELDGFL